MSKVWVNNLPRSKILEWIMFISTPLSFADIFCMPSKYESFGMVFLDAAQVKCPVYGSDVGVLSSLYPKSSIYPPLLKHPVNHLELFDHLHYYYKNPQIREKLREELLKCFPGGTILIRWCKKL